jgi:hypothetical protein
MERTRGKGFSVWAGVSVAVLSIVGLAHSGTSPIVHVDVSSQSPVCAVGGCLPRWQDGVGTVDDLTAQCGSDCARQRALKAVRMRQALGPQYTRRTLPGCTGNGSRSWVCPTETVTNYEVEEPIAGPEQAFVLEELALVVSATEEDDSSVALTESGADTKRWSAALATQTGSAAAAYTYTWLDTVWVEPGAIVQTAARSGQSAYLAPMISVQWEQVNYFRGRDAYGNLVRIGAIIRPKVTLRGTMLRSVPTGTVPPPVAVANAAQVLQDALNRHLDRV